MLLTTVTTQIFVALVKHSALPIAAGLAAGAGEQP